MSIQGALLGALKGASIGGIFGWYGAAIGAVIGLVIGAFTGPGGIAGLFAPGIQVPGAPALEALSYTSNTIGILINDVLGTTKLTGTLLVFGAERSVAVTQEVGGGGKGGGDSETQTTGYEYYMSWAIGLCVGPVDGLVTIFRNEDVVWSGNLVRPESGGEETIVIAGMGSMTFYFGTTDQAANADVGALLDDSTLNTPYRGLCWAFFKDCYIGSYNRMPTMRFVLSKMPAYPAVGTSVIATYDYNAALAIWYVLHDMAGLPEAWLHEADFAAVAATLVTEGRGVSICFGPNQSALAILESINGHIDSLLRYGSDGKFHPKLIRNDYDPDELPVIAGAAILDDPTFSRKSWIDTINEVKVQYTEIPRAHTVVAVASADGYWQPGIFSTTLMRFGLWIYQYVVAFANFTSINIPKGAIIDWAYLDFTPSEPSSFEAGYLPTGLQFVPSDSPVVPTTEEEGNALTVLTGCSLGPGNFLRMEGETEIFDVLVLKANHGCLTGGGVNVLGESSFAGYHTIVQAGPNADSESAFYLQGAECYADTSVTCSIDRLCNVHWQIDAPWEQDVTYRSPTVAANLQAIIDRPGWAFGGSVLAVMKGPMPFSWGLINYVAGTCVSVDPAKATRLVAQWHLEEDIDIKSSTADPVASDVGNREIQGRVVSRAVQTALFTDNENAVWAGRQALLKSSYPFATVGIPVNRKAFRIEVGDCFKFSYAQYGVSNMICRALQISEEGPESEAIMIQAIEDFFSITNAITTYAVPASHIQPVVDYAVLPLEHIQIGEAPYAISPEIKLVPLACKKSSRDLGFDVYMSTDAGASYSFLKRVGNLNPYGTLVGSYSEDTWTIDDAIGFTVDFLQGVGEIETAAWGDIFSGQKNVALLGDEILSFQSITPVAGTQYKLEGIIRGRYDTEKQSHLAGTELYVLPVALATLLSSGEIMTGASRKFKFVPYNIKALGDIAEATALDLTITGRALTPYKPGNFMANGGAFAARYDTDIILTWSPRYRGKGAGIGFPGTVLPDADREGLFKVEVYVAAVLVRTTDAIDAATWTYTEAMNTADNGTPAPALEFKLSNYRAEGGNTYESAQAVIACKKN